MKMKKLLILTILTIFLLGSISAFMLPDHQMMNDKVIQTYQGSSPFYELCYKYPELCFVGDALVDVSVIYYYTAPQNGIGVKYQVTHSPGFCANMMANARAYPEFNVSLEEARACAVGSCLHASQDVVSHTQMVPYAIRHTFLPNQVIHVFAEQKLSNIIQKDHPELKGEIESLTPEDWYKCVPLVKDTLEGYTEYEDDIITGKTDELINAFIFEVYNSVSPSSATSYDLAFKNKVSIFGKIGLVPVGFLIGYISFMLFFGTICILTIFKKDKNFLNYLVIIIFGVLAIILLIVFIALLNGNAFETIIFMVKPISNLVPIGNSQSYIDQSVENGYHLFDEGEGFIADLNNPKIASGYQELNKANEDIKGVDYMIVIVVISLFLLLIYKNFKRKSGGYSIKL